MRTSRATADSIAIFLKLVSDQKLAIERAEGRDCLAGHLIQGWRAQVSRVKCDNHYRSTWDRNWPSGRIHLSNPNRRIWTQRDQRCLQDSGHEVGAKLTAESGDTWVGEQVPFVGLMVERKLSLSWCRRRRRLASYFERSPACLRLAKVAIQHVGSRGCFTAIPLIQEITRLHRSWVSQCAREAKPLYKLQNEVGEAMSQLVDYYRIFLNHAEGLEPPTTNGEAVDNDQPLSGNKQDILQYLLLKVAVNSDNRQVAAEIAKGVAGAAADVNAFKGPLADLVKARFLESKRGCGGGYWLTEAGKSRAKK